MAYKPNIRRLVDDRDVDGLVNALRYPEDPEIRARAARALGKLGKVKPVESLIRSHLQDPDPGAQQAALEALQQLLGSEAELAISAYSLPDDPWIEDKIVPSEHPQEESEGSDSGADDLSFEEDLEEDEDDLEEEDQDVSLDQISDAGDIADGGETSWGENDIQALFSVIRLDHSRKKRSRAVQALSQIQNTRAIDALASIALWSEEKWLRAAAREALSAIYGESLDEVLQSYREGSPEAGLAEYEDEGDEDDEGEEDIDDDFDEDEEEVDDDFDEDEDDEDFDEEEEGETGGEVGSVKEDFDLPPGPSSQSSPVIHEEKPGWVTYLLLGLLFVAVLLGVIYLLTR